MSRELIEKLIQYLQKSIQGCLITGYNPDAEKTTKFSVSIQMNNRFGFVFFVNIGEIDWSTGEFVLKNLQEVGGFPDYLIRILSSFNPPYS